MVDDKISAMKELVGRTEENYYNQIDLGKYGLESNKKFIEGLFLTEGLDGVKRNFSQKKGDETNRKIDGAMNLDSFLERINKENFLYFKIILEDFDFRNISYAAIFKEKDTDHFLMIECDYNENNFEKIEKLYGQAFGIKLRKEKVDPILAKIYKSRR